MQRSIKLIHYNGSALFQNLSKHRQRVYKTVSSIGFKINCLNKSSIIHNRTQNRLLFYRIIRADINKFIRINSKTLCCFIQKSIFIKLIHISRIHIYYKSLIVSFELRHKKVIKESWNIWANHSLKTVNDIQISLFQTFFRIRQNQFEVLLKIRQKILLNRFQIFFINLKLVFSSGKNIFFIYL